MIRIHRVADDASHADAEVIRAAEVLLRKRFPTARPQEFADLGARLRNPYDDGFRTLLYVAETSPGRLRGCAVVSHDPVAGFFLLDWLVADARETGGVGGAIYARVREDAARLDCVGVFLEALPDQPGEVSDPAVLADNVGRLKFYERHGARPIVGTAWREPLKPGELDLPWLLFGPASKDTVLGAAKLCEVVRAILERKYAWLCPPEYVERVVGSIADPVALREPRYERADKRQRYDLPAAERVVLVVHDGHGLHHVRERGYVEAPARVDRILAVLEPAGLVRRVERREFPREVLTRVHDSAYVDFLEQVCTHIPPKRRVYPYVFPIRNTTRMPDDLPVRAGYYCIDTFTPLHRELFGVAKGAVDCALTAAEEIQRGARAAYALVRPPGHHAEAGVYGGFCYFNNAALAAQHLLDGGCRRIAMLDIDYHHGNGQQQIFYRRADVLTVSIHGHPSFAYPYFTGFDDETGEGEGVGYNLNVPLAERLDGSSYRQALAPALERIVEYDPEVLIVCLGLDTASGDPTGTWSLRAADFRENGRRVRGLGKPTLVVQEGGYGLRSVGRNALAFLAGLSGH